MSDEIQNETPVSPNSRINPVLIVLLVLPLLGIIIAFMFLSEIPTWNTFYGGLLIVSTVVIESIRTSRQHKKVSI